MNVQDPNIVMRPLFAYEAKKPLHTGVRTGVHDLSSIYVCLSVCLCNIRVLYTHCCLWKWPRQKTNQLNGRCHI